LQRQLERKRLRLVRIWTKSGATSPYTSVYYQTLNWIRSNGRKLEALAARQKEKGRDPCLQQRGSLPDQPPTPSITMRTLRKFRSGWHMCGASVDTRSEHFSSRKKRPHSKKLCGNHLQRWHIRCYGLSADFASKMD